MTDFLLTPTPTQASRLEIFCPSLSGLTISQADLAVVMPRLDHNRAIREAPRQCDWVTALPSDPFGAKSTLLQRLIDLGYEGVMNWPSSVLFEGALREAMKSVPATPGHEYAFLKMAEDKGLGSMAVFRSLEQGHDALAQGLRQLVLHPGIVDLDRSQQNKMLSDAYGRIIRSVRNAADNVKILVISSDAHERVLSLSALDVDGIIWLDLPA